MQAQEIKRPKPLWQRQCDRLRVVVKFTVIAQRILICGLIAALIGIVLDHFTRLPRIHLRWAAIFFIAAWVGVEILGKCLSAYFLGAARAGWMNRRSALVDVCSHLATCADELQAFTVGKPDSWIKPLREIANWMPGEVQKILTGVN